MAPEKKEGPLARAHNYEVEDVSHAADDVSSVPDGWSAPDAGFSFGPILQEAGAFFEDAVAALWGLVQADIKPGEFTAVMVVLLRSWFRGQPTASIPAPADTGFAQLACLEWKNISPHVESCLAKGMFTRNVENSRCVDYTPVHPKFWRVRWRRPRTEINAVIEAISIAIPIGVQALLSLGVLEAGTNPKDRRRAEQRKTEAQNKSGEARPSSTEIQNIPGLPGFPSAPACTEIQNTPASVPANSSSNPHGDVPASTEIQNIHPPLKSSESFSSTKLSTAEAVKALKGGATGELREAAVAHVNSLGDEEKRDFCRELPMSERQRSLKSRVLQQIGSKESAAWGGKWHNAIKLDAHAVEQALKDRERAGTEGRPVPERSEGGWLFDLARRWSPLLQAWYPKPGE
jgi:hypothetical protein